MFYKGKLVESHSKGSDFHGRGEEIRKELKARIPTREGMKVLDIGTGFGNTVSFLRRTLPAGTQVWSVDPSEETLKNAKKKLKEEGLLSRVTFRRGTIEKLPFEEGFFDVAASVMVLHHLEAPQVGLKEVARVLRPDGVLVIADWAPEAHVLPFSSLHRESDFFGPEGVTDSMRRAGLEPKMTKFPMWYLIEATRGRRSKFKNVPKRLQP